MLIIFLLQKILEVNKILKSQNQDFFYRSSVIKTKQFKMKFYYLSINEPTCMSENQKGSPFVMPCAIFAYRCDVGLF